jgi:hypothetical protein
VDIFGHAGMELSLMSERVLTCSIQSPDQTEQPTGDEFDALNKDDDNGYDAELDADMFGGGPALGTDDAGLDVKMEDAEAGCASDALDERARPRSPSPCPPEAQAEKAEAKEEDAAAENSADDGGDDSQSVAGKTGATSSSGSVCKPDVSNKKVEKGICPGWEKKTCLGCCCGVTSLTLIEKASSSAHRLWGLSKFWGPFCAWCSKMARIRFGTMSMAQLAAYCNKPVAQHQVKMYSFSYVSLREEGRIQVSFCWLRFFVL